MLVVEPVEEVALRGIRMPVRRREPLVVVAAMVGGEVADHLQPALVRGRHEPGERVISAEQRVNIVERCRVVAVIRPSREYGCEVDERDAEVGQVVQALGRTI